MQIVWAFCRVQMVPALSMCSDGTLLGFVYCNEQFFLVDFVYSGLRHYDMYVLNF